MLKARMVGLGTGKCLGCVAASLSSPNIHTVDCASGIKEPAQPLQAGFCTSLVPYHNFEL